MLVFHLSPGFGTLETLNATPTILSSSVLLLLQTPNSKCVKRTLLMIHLRVCTIKGLSVDVQILFGSELRGSTTHIS